MKEQVHSAGAAARDDSGFARTDTIYLDFQATTPLDERVLEVMLPWLRVPANPHATHVQGQRARAAVEEARCRIAAAICVNPEAVIFTSGSTEAANLALRSLPVGSRIVASAIEHPCVLETLRRRDAELDVVLAPVGRDGVLDLDAFSDVIGTADIACIMAVNNEIGTCQPLDTISNITRMFGAALLTDVSQAVGRISIDLGQWDAAGAWLSSHKIYGPQGIGALVWRSERPLRPSATGGGQERGFRSGTVPTALAVGFGAACEIAIAEMERDRAHTQLISKRMLAAILSRLPDTMINGSLDERIPHNLNLAFPGVDADALVASIPEVAISTGSACSAGALDVSHVLQAIEIGELAESSIRIGFGRRTSTDEVDAAATLICDAVERLRSTQRRHTRRRA